MDIGQAKPIADDLWPPLPWDEWNDTCDTLHLWTQIVGKVKLELCPFLNELWQVAFYPSPRGLTTGRIPYAQGAFAVQFDFVDHSLQVITSSGHVGALRLFPRSVADFYHEFMATLRALGIEVSITGRPDEVPDPHTFCRGSHPRRLRPTYVRRWWSVILQVSDVFDRYRSSFMGKSSPVLFWWGSFDLSTSRYSGRPAPVLTGVPRFMELAEDQENFCCGFWPGNATASGIRYDEPMFFRVHLPGAAGVQRGGHPARFSPL